MFLCHLEHNIQPTHRSYGDKLYFMDRPKNLQVSLTVPVLQIRWGKKDNLGIIFHIIPLKCMLYPSSELSCQDSSHEGSQHMFLLRGHNICIC